MPAPKDDRAALERERDELPALIATYEHELLATPVEEMEKRQQLRWQLRLAEKRLAETADRGAVTGHPMPRPESEREAWEAELKEFTSLLAQYHRELEATPVANQERRERLRSQPTKRAEKRMAEL